MRSVYLIGWAQSPVTPKGELLLGAAGAGVVKEALKESRVDPARVDSLHIGNMLSGILSHQQQLGSLIADCAGMTGIEAHTSEAACSSGAVAAREGFLRVASGFSEVVVACGVEVMTVAAKEDITRALATATDWTQEGAKGETFVSLNASLMREYMRRYRVSSDAFGGFAVNAHDNALTNQYAVLRKAVDAEMYQSSRILIHPMRLYDVSPICNGAAAVVLASESVAREVLRSGRPLIRVAGSAVATDTPALRRRSDPLDLRAVKTSTDKALEMSGADRRSIDLFELHDAYSIMTVLTIEAAGFARQGAGITFAEEGRIRLLGDLPISTFGGLKARGHPVGATGIYQYIEAGLQLSRTAGPNQVPDAEVALVQNIGGVASTVVTHVLRREA